MNRADLQRLARSRLREARILFNAGEYNGAYYLAGYSIECALKAWIAKRTAEFDFPDKKLANDAWSHDLKKLLTLADARSEYISSFKQSSLLQANWTFVEQWSETSRYQVHSQESAASLLDAIDNATDGVFLWIERQW